MATESVGDETGGPGGSGYETGDKTAATAGDEGDGGDRWDNVYRRRELEFDEDEMAALEGQRLVAEFTRCTSSSVCLSCQAIRRLLRQHCGVLSVRLVVG